jgi:hypothetical protein
MWNITHYGGFFVYAKFHGQILIKTKLLVLLLHCNVCDTFCKFKMYFN